MTEKKEKENSTPEKKDLTPQQEISVAIYNALVSKFPNTNFDRISILLDLMKLEIRALSFKKLQPKHLETIGPKVIKEIEAGLTNVWEEDKVHREKRTKNEDSN